MRLSNGDEIGAPDEPRIVFNRSLAVLACTVCMGLIPSPGPLILADQEGGPVCVDCARNVWPELATICLAVDGQYRAYVPRDGDDLLLCEALLALPEARWRTPTGESWWTNDILRRVRFANTAAPVLDLNQPVLWSGDRLFPVCDLPESMTEPFLTLERTRHYDGTLNTSLSDRGAKVWIALDGLCWEAEDLRARLTLRQRATRVTDEQYLGNVEVVTDEANRVLFLLTEHRAHARDALVALVTASESDSVLASGISSAYEARPATPEDSVYWPIAADKACDA